MAGLWTYGEWRHVATGCTVLMITITVTQIISSDGEWTGFRPLSSEPRWRHHLHGRLCT